jgi:rhodanese-related sulfurtransferase
MDPQSPSHSPAHAAVREINRDQLREKLARDDKLKLVMASSDWSFRAKHLPGSLHFHTPEQMLAALGKDEPIVIYCSNVDCHASLAIYQRLIDHGYSDVSHYAGGLIDWESAGLPLEGDWVTSPSTPPTPPR